MNYGQLIWDVPKIQKIKKMDELESKEKVVETFLKSVGIKTSKYYSEYTILSNREKVHIYGYDIGENSDLPFFNYSDAVKKNKNVFFLIASDEEWNGYRATRKKDRYYYLFKLDGKKSVENSGTKVEWNKLKDCCTLISMQTRTDHLFRKKR